MVQQVRAIEPGTIGQPLAARVSAPGSPLPVHSIPPGAAGELARSSACACPADAARAGEMAVPLGPESALTEQMTFSAAGPMTMLRFAGGCTSPAYQAFPALGLP
jgi:hypothetical protein